MKVNIYDVAKRSGLSVVTVSRVINNVQTVRKKNREKVLQAMKELNYSPHSAARTLARGKTGVIGLILTALRDSVFEEIVREINEQLENHGYFLAISIDGAVRREPENRTNYLIQPDRVDGIILLSSLKEREYVQELKAKNIPFVLIDHHDPDTEAVMVQVDNYAGGYMAARHLLEKGHREIGLICGPEHLLSAQERRQGFEQALADAGLSPAVVAQVEFDTRVGFHTAQEWIAAGHRITALSAGDDFLALGAMQAYQAAGYRIPEDIAIIGYDDQDFASKIHPSLTTVRQPVELMGREAVKQLLAMLEKDAQEKNVRENDAQEKDVRENDTQEKDVLEKDVLEMDAQDADLAEGDAKQKSIRKQLIQLRPELIIRNST